MIVTRGKDDVWGPQHRPPIYGCCDLRIQLALEPELKVWTQPGTHAERATSAASRVSTASALRHATPIAASSGAAGPPAASPRHPAAGDSSSATSDGEEDDPWPICQDTLPGAWLRWPSLPPALGTQLLHLTTRRTTLGPSAKTPCPDPDPAGPLAAGPQHPAATPAGEEDEPCPIYRDTLTGA